MWFEDIFILLIVAGVLFMLGRGLRQMGWFGGTQHRVSSGAASFLGELDHMLNPQRPTIEDIRAAKEDDDDRDDEGDPPEIPTHFAAASGLGQPLADEPLGEHERGRDPHADQHR